MPRRASKQGFVSVSLWPLTGGVFSPTFLRYSTLCQFTLNSAALQRGNLGPIIRAWPSRHTVVVNRQSSRFTMVWSLFYRNGHVLRNPFGIHDVPLIIVTHR